MNSFLYNKKLVIKILEQINSAIQTIQRRFEKIDSADDFTSTSAGMDMFDGICMLVIAIGESLKNEEIYWICSHHMEPLCKTIKKMLEDIKNGAVSFNGKHKGSS